MCGFSEIIGAMPKIAKGFRRIYIGQRGPSKGTGCPDWHAGKQVSQRKPTFDEANNHSKSQKTVYNNPFFSITFNIGTAFDHAKSLGPQACVSIYDIPEFIFDSIFTKTDNMGMDEAVGHGFIDPKFAAGYVMVSNEAIFRAAMGQALQFEQEKTSVLDRYPQFR